MWWIPGSGSVVHVETTRSCRGDSWREAAEKPEGVLCILSSIMNDSHLDSKENVQVSWSKVKPCKAHMLLVCKIAHCSKQALLY